MVVESVYPGGVSVINIPGLGSMEPLPALDHLDLLAPPVAEALTALARRGVATASSALVAAIDPDLTDTEIMTEAFGMDLALSSNCILVAGKRLGEERIAACVVRASMNADINHVVKNRLDVRKASFWPQERAVAASGMEYGGITPVGVPASWRLLIDSACASGWNCIGSGLRRSKLFVTGQILAALPGAELIEGLGI
ncbi:Cys-tRNA(Pro) deacylase, prolyl-tRNA editing enzyme YbaK/EbsC [Schaalia meyeri]|nr:Cys-tRNA(Pro) deacylase, prolyl-tRNA editing enzyme YbaK/EbsC [Schaalia meyeri]